MLFYKLVKSQLIKAQSFFISNSYSTSSMGGKMFWIWFKLYTQTNKLRAAYIDEKNSWIRIRSRDADQ